MDIPKKKKENGTKAGERGFTILEIMIVMGIISIMTAVAVPNLVGVRNRQAVENAAREAASMVRETQHYALTGARLDENHYPCKYKIERSSANSLKISYEHRIASDTCASSSSSQDHYTYTFGDGVDVGIFSAITFSIPHGGSNINQNEKVRITLSRGADKYSVCVYPTGNILEIKGEACP